MDLSQAITRLSAAGVSLRVDGDRLTVESVDPLTDQQRAWLREHKPALLRLLTAPPPPDLTAEDQANIDEAIAERAAIQEHDGGLTKADAEREARSAMRVYHYLLRDQPDQWLTLIAPGADIREARRHLLLIFGTSRVVDVIEHRPRRAA